MPEVEEVRVVYLQAVEEVREQLLQPLVLPARTSGSDFLEDGAVSCPAPVGGRLVLVYV